MVNENQAPTDYQYLCSFSGSQGGVASGSFQAVETTAELVETWGQPLMGSGPAASGFQCGLGCNGLTPTFSWFATLYTPNNLWGTFSTGGSGFITSGHWRIVVGGEYLVVNSDCTWTYGFSSFDAWLQIGTGPEVHEIHYTTPYAVSGFNYDRRLNRTVLLPVAMGLFDSAPGLICEGPGVGLGSENLVATVSGGYEPKVAGVYTPDPVTFDPTTTVGACSCLSGLPLISGVDSYSCSLTAEWSFGVSEGSHSSFTCPCTGAGGGILSGFYYTRNQTFAMNSFNGLSIVANTQAMCSQEIDVEWACNVDGVPTSGSSVTVSETTTTICACNRITQNDIQVQNGCNVATGYNFLPCDGTMACEPCFDCSYHHCVWGENVNLFWPNLPVCGGTCGGTCGSPTIMVTDEGETHFVCIQSGDLYYSWSPYPTAVFQTATRITTNGGWSGWDACKFCWVPDYRRSEILAYHLHQGGGDPLATGLYRITTEDDGATFGPIVASIFTPELVLANATQADMIHVDGNLVNIAFVPDSGTTGPGTFKVRTAIPAGATFSGWAVIVDNTSTNLHSDGNGWGFADRGDGQISLTFTKSGETDAGVYMSGDLGSTFMRTI